MKKDQKKIVLLDAHAIIHRAYHALPNFATSKGEPTGAVYGLVAMVLKIVKDLKPNYMVACFDLPKPTYRHEFYKDYKAGRAKADDELISQFKLSREALEALSIPILEAEGFEADDLLGTISDQILKNNKDTDVIIASGDKDTLQLVLDDKVQVYTLKKGINETIIYNEKKVIERFGFGPKLIPDFKGLSGDPSDNIVGIPGIGEKTATDLIVNFGSIENIYKTLEKDENKLLEKGIKPRIVNLLKEHKDEAEFSKILATIRLDAPNDFKLPKTDWRESVSLEKADGFFAKMEFRAMPGRFREAIEFAHSSVVRQSEGEGGQGSLNIGSTAEKENKYDGQTIILADEDLQKFAIMVWLLNSSITDPKEEDIYGFTGSRDKLQIEKILKTELEKNNLTKVYEKIEEPLLPVVEKMTTDGILLDVPKLEELKIEYKKYLKEAEKKIWELAGEEFNIASPKQVSEIIFGKMNLGGKYKKKTETGAFTTKESELQKMKDEHPIIPLILEYREFSKLLSTYIETLPNLIGPDGRIHARFIQTGTATGRLSSVGPNMQNIPKSGMWGKKIREAFIAEKGKVLLALDYSQIELRVGAFLSGDKKMIETFKTGKDIHTAVASEVFGVSEDEVTKDMRAKAKVINFGVMYGMGVRALKMNLGVEMSEAKKFYDEYFEKFSGLAKYLEETKEKARKEGFVETFFGRRRSFDGLRSPLPQIRAMNERMAINAPIQGTEADIVKLAMVQVSKLIKERGWEDSVKMLLQVHDELVFEVEKDMLKDIFPELKKVMENILSLKETKGVKLSVEGEWGNNWGALRELT